MSNPVKITETVTVRGLIKRESEAAILLVIKESFNSEEEDPVWFPLSQVKSIHRTHSFINQTLDSLVVSVWIAKQKGIL